MGCSREVQHTVFLYDEFLLYGGRASQLAVNVHIQTLVLSQDLAQGMPVRGRGWRGLALHRPNH